MTTLRVMLLGFGLVLIVAAVVQAAPQGQADEAPMPYDYKYEVKDPEKKLFFDANELGDNSGKVSGGYRVLLPDGRLMTVEYMVEGESGFVPKITFQENAQPF